MKDHKELNSLVVSTLKKYNSQGYTPTARQLFADVKKVSPVHAKKGFKSFIKVINFFPDVQSQKNYEGDYRTYSLRKKM